MTHQPLQKPKGGPGEGTVLKFKQWEQAMASFKHLLKKSETKMQEALGKPQGLIRNKLLEAAERVAGQARDAAKTGKEFKSADTVLGQIERAKSVS